MWRKEILKVTGDQRSVHKYEVQGLSGKHPATCYEK